MLSKEDWWQLLLSCLLTLCEVQRYEEAELLVQSAMEFYSFYDNKPQRKAMEFFGLSATILDRNHYKAYDYIRRVRPQPTTTSLLIHSCIGAIFLKFRQSSIAICRCYR